MVSSALPNWAEAVSAVVSALALLTVVFAVVPITFHNRQIHREFESLYLGRYWDLMDRRSSRFALRGTPDRSDITVVHAYLRLSEDQLGLRAIGRVTDHTWRFWARDISAQCSVPAYSKYLAAAPKSEFPRVREMLSVGVEYDPLDHGFIWRKVHGL